MLADGSVYEGYAFGADVDTYGEVVFNTSMVGYQEMLTDPSYAGQIVVPTYPLIGNYGVNDYDFESGKVQVRGFVVREECPEPSHYLSQRTLHHYLAEAGTPGIAGVDSRALTRRLRSIGVMMGMITTTKTPGEALEQIKGLPSYGSVDFVREVTTAESYHFGLPCDQCVLKIKCLALGNSARKFCGRREIAIDAAPAYHLVALDCGLKFNILRRLSQLGGATTVLPCIASAADILALEPDGIVLSPGPGDPELLDYIVETVKGLLGKKPIMGICLGNQLIARAFGGRNFKLKFGHRGANHPVRDLDTGKVYITAQNHGYAVDPDSLKDGLEVTHINLNDGTVEGLRHKELPVFAIQYHAEASPGPWDSTYLFEQFVGMIKEKNPPESPFFKGGN